MSEPSLRVLLLRRLGLDDELRAAIREDFATSKVVLPKLARAVASNPVSAAKWALRALLEKP